MHWEVTGHWGVDMQAKGVFDHVGELHQATPFPTQDSEQATGDLNLTTIPT
jgi:hypothetical protein